MARPGTTAFPTPSSLTLTPKNWRSRLFPALRQNRNLPVRTGVDVTRLERKGDVFRATTSDGMIEAKNVVVATGPFQNP